MGHPEIITHPEDEDITHYFGVAKVDVVPPFRLYHPILPYRHNGKLLLPLCRSCADREMAKSLLKRSCGCPHAPEERTPELVKAVQMGYRILHIQEVLHFPEPQ